MPSGTVLESTSGKKDGRTGIKKTKNKDLSSYIIYRPEEGANNILIAAGLFYDNRTKYHYELGHWLEHSKVTRDDITKPAKSGISCIGLAEGCVNYLSKRTKKACFNYDSGHRPDNGFGFTKEGKVSLNNMPLPGDILVRDSGGVQHYVVFIGDSELLTKELVMRLRFPEYGNTYYYTKNMNPFVGSVSADGPDGPTGTYHNCTWYAYGRFCEIAGRKCDLPAGDAGSWYNNYGGKKGSSPKLGAVACYPNHVAVVEKIFENGSILLSNSAWNNGSAIWNGVNKGKGGSCGGQPKESPKNYYAHKHSDTGDDNYSYPYFYTSVANPPDYIIPHFNDVEKSQGFIYQDVDISGLSGDTYGEAYVALDLRQTSSRLKSSMNYKYVYGYDEVRFNERKSDSLYEYDINARENTTKLREMLLEFAEQAKNGLTDGKTTVSDERVENLVYSYADASSADSKIPKSRVNVSPGILPVTEALVQAPFVELDFGNDNVIGSYMAKDDRFPNHIASMSVDKVNGEINQYTFNVIHQIRAGEDPNLLDKIFSSVRYDPIKLRYGDSADRRFYIDEKIILTNIVMNRDYAASKITYTLYGTSTCAYVTSYKMNFPAVFDKPSNQILKMLYDDPITSPLLLEAFPGMANRTEVESKGLIPTNDRAIVIEAQTQVSIWERLQNLVSLLSMATRATGDLLGVAVATAGVAAAEILDSVTDKMFDAIGEVAGTVGGAAAGGIVGAVFAGPLGAVVRGVAGGIVGNVSGSLIGKAIKTALIPAKNNVLTTLGMVIGTGTAVFGNIVASGLDWLNEHLISYFLEQDNDTFKITGVRKVMTSSGRLTNITNTIYEITVGYPGEECVMDFKVNQDSGWSALMDKGLVSDEYVYAINREGVTIKRFSPNLFSTTNAMTRSEQSWWEFMLTFPISAELTIKGLVKPTKLMDYILINVNFYGMPHITTGLYVVTAEQEVLSSENGFITKLTLLRVDSE